MADISVKLGASGVSQFRQQMNQATGAVKAMDAELKTCEAQYQATGDQQQYLADKSALLKKQLEEQKKAVAAAEKALELVKKQYGENSSQANAWRTKLAQARTTLIQTESAIRNTDAAMDALGKDDVSGLANGLHGVETAAENAESAAGNLGDAVGQIAGKLNKETVIDGLGAISNAMIDVMKTAARMGAAIWNASTDAATWADSTRDAATAAGMTTTEYQQMAYAAQFFGLSIEDLTSKQGKLVKAMDAGGQIMVGDWAVDTIDRVTGKKRSFSNVMTDIVDGLSQIEDPVARDAAAMDLFGKSYTDLNGLIQGGQDAWQERINEAPVVSEDYVNSLADEADAIKTTGSQLNALKMEVLATLAPDIKLIAEAVGALAEKLTEFVQSERGQELLTKLAGAIESIVTSIVDQDFEGIVGLAEKAIEGLTGAFNWISEHKESLVTAIGAIGAAFMGLNVLALGFKGSQILTSFKSLLGLGAPVPAQTTTTATAAAPAAAPDLNKASGIIAAGMTPYMTMMYDPVNTEDVRRAWEMNPEDVLMSGLGIQPDSYQADLLGYANRALNTRVGGFLGIGAHTDPARIWGGISRFQKAAGLESIIGSDLYGELMRATPSTASDDLLRRVTDVVSITDAGVFEENVQQMEEAGLSMAEGEVEGLEDGADDVAAAAEEALGKGPVNRVKTVLQMHSPSRVMAGLGYNMAAGLADGIDEGAKLAIDAASSMASAVASIVQSAIQTMNMAGALAGGLSGRTGAGGGSYYDGSTTINIGSYNQTGGGDMYALAGVVAAAQKHGRQGYGARR